MVGLRWDEGGVRSLCAERKRNLTENMRHYERKGRGELLICLQEGDGRWHLAEANVDCQTAGPE